MQPPSGVAYYFSPSGEQVRKLPEYHVGASGKVNYDDIPVVHDPCTKNYPEGKYSGLWLHVSLLLSHSWPLLQFSFDCWGRGKKGPIFISFQAQEDNVQGNIL